MAPTPDELRRDRRDMYLELGAQLGLLLLAVLGCLGLLAAGVWELWGQLDATGWEPTATTIMGVTVLILTGPLLLAGAWLVGKGATKNALHERDKLQHNAARIAKAERREATGRRDGALTEASSVEGGGLEQVGDDGALTMTDEPGDREA